MDLVDAVIATARSGGVDARKAVMLRSTNNIVAWLAPSDLVAKIAPDPISSLGLELSWAHRLANLGAPIVPPAAMMGATVLRIADCDVTFWRYAAQGAEPPLRSAAIADPLSRLHRALHYLEPPQCTVADDLHTAIRSLDDEVFAPGLTSRDRRLLQRAMRAVAGLVDDVPMVVHGSPHRFNVVSVDGQARFIDFETVARGPVEWDLAHLEPEAAAGYPEAVRPDLLAQCRLAISALTASHCWHGRHRGPDMIDHARHHLEIVRQSSD